MLVLPAQGGRLPCDWPAAWHRQRGCSLTAYGSKLGAEHAKREDARRQRCQLAAHARPPMHTSAHKPTHLPTRPLPTLPMGTHLCQ